MTGEKRGIPLLGGGCTIVVSTRADSETRSSNTPGKTARRTVNLEVDLPIYLPDSFEGSLLTSPKMDSGVDPRR